MNPTGFLLIAPLIIPLLTAIAGLFGMALRPNSRQVQRIISTVGGLLLISALALFDGVRRGVFRLCRLGHGLCRLASRWSPMCSARSWSWFPA
jgi:uncharacterized membrane protein